MIKNIIIIALAAVILFLVFKKKQSAPTQNFLQIGSTGANVLKLQKKLNNIINTATTAPVWVQGNQAAPLQVIVEDGVFGATTLIALLAITGKPAVAIADIDKIELNNNV